MHPSPFGCSLFSLTVNMSLSQEVLGDLPQKTFTDVSVPMKSSPLNVPLAPPAPAAGNGGKGNPAAMGALDRVLRLLQVGSKRFLTNKVR